MLDSITPIHSIQADGMGSISPEIYQSTVPVVLRGLVSHWPAVLAAKQGAETAANYVKQFYSGGMVNAAVGLEGKPVAEGMGNKVFYNEDLTGFTYERKMEDFARLLDTLASRAADPSAPLLYADSTLVDRFLKGFREQNDIGLSQFNPRVSMWAGNRTIVSAHHDIPDNIACVVAGRRRFVLFPPQQVENLYIGPLDFNPAGPAISMVDLHNPDFKKFPKYRQAIENAVIAELEPGDAIFIPSMWWHHVEGLEGFNLMVNYWWTATPEYLGSPQDAFNHALMSIKALPADERQAWKALFEHFIFNSDDTDFSHIPEEKLGVLGDIDETKVRRLKAGLLNRLNR